ncbi:hypothetical protein XarbCFBP7408_14035 [Xanthomonas arboricola pv. guizotiae]|uniref:Phosphatidylserine decarboxylase n=1 Tax=Xanthomonas arboricola pv. guizotiae TaxID=487867 RepID=A0A2S7A1R4_9XANT|nr:hypothetical protein XarbCFBP7409_10790 [Xanthomonas arboricola pv. guizotiae]PPU22728.1 hypothetical protein XarbCFBP7408_14035 [Xanthomonas arboricola pv. guizotiae]
MDQGAKLLATRHARQSKPRRIAASCGGGAVVQIFLSGADYHRWHAPVDGVVPIRTSMACSSARTKTIASIPTQVRHRRSMERRSTIATLSGAMRPSPASSPA